MVFSVAISSRAEKNLEEIISYLETEWSIRVRDKYLSILEQKIKLISESPSIYPASIKRKSIHRCILTKHSILYYKTKGDHIEIITIQDSRRDPKKLKL